MNAKDSARLIWQAVRVAAKLPTWHILYADNRTGNVVIDAGILRVQDLIGAK